MDTHPFIAAEPLVAGLHAVQTPVLPSGYYLNNFERLIQVVSAHRSAAISRRERRFIALFQDLPLGARRLYVRLACRRGPLFRVDDLKYDEIEDLGAQIDTLLQVGLLTSAVGLPPEPVLAKLRKAELERWAGELGVEIKGLRKMEIVARILIERPHEAYLDGPCRVPLVRRLGDMEVAGLRLLFFGNLRQDLSDFVVTELGVIQYPVYRIGDAPLFSNAQAKEQVWAFADLRAMVYEALDAGCEDMGLDLADMLVANPPPQAIQTRSWHRLVTTTGRILERRGELDRAEAHYRASSRDLALDRLARIETSRGRHAEALALCTRIQKGGAGQKIIELNAALFRRLSRGPASRGPGARGRECRLSGLPTKRPSATWEERSVQLCAGEHGVEADVLAACDQKSVVGFHVENRLFLGIFGLTFWPVIYADVPGAFFHPFQVGPVDLHDPSFGERRDEGIRVVFDHVRRNQGWRRDVLLRWDAWFGTANPFVRWGALPRECVELALERIDNSAFLAVFERLIGDLRHNRSGLPDLLLFPSGGGFELAEVKGPGDRLQPHQRGWLTYLAGRGVPVSVIRVVRPEDNAVM